MNRNIIDNVSDISESTVLRSENQQFNSDFMKWQPVRHNKGNRKTTNIIQNVPINYSNRFSGLEVEEWIISEDFQNDQNDNRSQDSCYDSRLNVGNQRRPSTVQARSCRGG